MNEIFLMKLGEIVLKGGNKRQFESRLRFQPVENVEQLNAAAFAWANAYNANLIPGQDTRLRRTGLTTPVARYDLWQLIKSDQLRLLPPVEVCQALMTGKEAERKVDGHQCITFKHPKAERSMTYSLRGMDGIKEATYELPGKTVRVCVVSGIANARKVMDGVRAGELHYDFIEIMACPGGCSALRTSCTRRSLLVKVPSLSHHIAEAGSTTSA